MATVGQVRSVAAPHRTAIGNPRNPWKHRNPINSWNPGAYDVDMARTATTQQVAAALGVTPSTVQTYSRERRIPFDVTPGGHRRYDIDEVRASLSLGGASALTPIVSSGLGAGREFGHSAMATFDAERRAVTGEVIVDPETVGAASAPVVPALIDFIEHSRRILVAV